MLRSLCVATIALGLVLPAVANAEKASADKVAADKPTIYCVKTEVTGSRIPQKVCKTRADWIAQDDYDPAAAQ